MKLIDRIRNRIFIMDGAMGTQLQEHVIAPEAWQNCEGCNELLNVTAPDVIRSVHAAYFQAGSDAVETNTFGASSLTLSEYNLADRAREFNMAAARIAREAADSFSTEDQPRYVFGSIGPGTKLPTLGQTSFDELCDSMQVQMEGLLEGGVDGILLETCQDLLQIKAGVVAYEKTVGKASDVPLYVSVTVEQTGTLLIGSNIGAVVAALAPLPVCILGLNCATGPQAMRIHLDYLAKHWPGFLACMPNAGMPLLKGTEVDYPLQPAEFSDLLGTMTRETGLNVVGGCCGTTPEHITALRNNLNDFSAPERSTSKPEQATSLFSAMDFEQKPPPLFIGERANATGSKKFRDALLQDDYEACFSILQHQEETGAHILDLCTAYTGRTETNDAAIIVERAARECRLPIMIDTMQTAVVETALKRYGGRMLINSINFESGEARAHEVVELARRYGAAIVGLTIDEEGMAKTAERKVAIARRLVDFCEKRGIARHDIFIDTLTFTIGSGDDTLRTAALETTEAIRRIKTEMPGVRTILGLSNISFGLKPVSRKILNTVFLDRCVKAGMDACIINVASIIPLNQIDDDARKVAEHLLDNDQTNGDPLDQFILFFEDVTLTETDEADDNKTPEEALADAVVRGRIPPLSDLLPVLLQEYKAEHILNELLVPAMKEVGRLFNDGLLQLPFVLKSAEVMKRAVDIIKPHMEKGDTSQQKATMVLATVSGDVHDIGKNLVDIILSNNGFNIVNLGTKIPVEQMIAAVREHKADVLGMSGLLVKSATLMAENMKALADEKIDVPVFLGGAALTPDFVQDTCQPNYDSPVVYCKDAFEGLTRMQEYVETGALKPPQQKEKAQKLPPTSKTAPTEPVEVITTPTPPFMGHRRVSDISIEDLFPLLNERAVVVGQWRYTKGKMSKEEYQHILDTEGYPKLEAMKKICLENDFFRPEISYGFFRCHAKENSLFVYENEKAAPVELAFPRQRKEPHIAIPDYFHTDQDVVGFQCVTLGNGLEKANVDLLKEDNYQDYFFWHGLAVQLTDALAEYSHRMIRKAWGFDESELDIKGLDDQHYRGSRYGFGYASCPDIAMNKIACDFVHADAMGVEVTESLMMVPEFTTAAIILHHPKAKYFNV